MRQLNADERAVWARVAGTIRPLKAARVATMRDAAPEGGLPVSHPSLPAIALLSKSSVVRPPDTGRHRPSQQSNTLDGSWDKRIRLGQVEPDVAIDLHGETLSSAHARLNRSLAAAIRNEARIILLITGRPPRDNSRTLPHGRGVIRASVGDWLAASPYASRIAAVRNAHPRHGGAGALYLILRRVR